MSLVEFLLARIAEDEALAREASVLPYDFMPFASHVLSSERDATPAMDEHVERWEPARVLAECEAKRRIVGYLDVVLAGSSGHSWRADDAHITLLALSLPYADHPDYDESWRP